VSWDSCIGPHGASVHLSARAENLDLQAPITHAAQRALDPSRPMGLYYHLRYQLWVGVRRDSSGTNGTTTEQKRLGRDQTGPDGTKGKL
jgi:hypothetical protein